MDISIARPELFDIVDDDTSRVSFGGNQAWFTSEWSRRAGCGPTSAANVLAYLALTRPALRALYGYDILSRTAFTKHMEEVYKFVTPGTMGLNRTEMYTDGVMNFAHSRGLTLNPHVFGVTSNVLKGRTPTAALTEFVSAGLNSNCPLGFLNLTKGRVKNLQSWHWITIISAQIEDNTLIAEASDEGLKRRFDLRLWYLSTRLSGGLVYFTHGPSP